MNTGLLPQHEKQKTNKGNNLNARRRFQSYHNLTLHGHVRGHIRNWGSQTHTCSSGTVNMLKVTFKTFQRFHIDQYNNKEENTMQW